MRVDDDSFWDELGVSWRASFRDAGLISSRLEARLRIQAALLTIGMIVGGALGLLGLALAAWTLWIGWQAHVWNFLTRGITIAAVSLLGIVAALALRGRTRVDTRSLREMLQASMARTERLIRAADLGCWSMAILAIGGLIGYAIRVLLGRPPAMSPVEGLLAVALAGLALLWYRRTQAHALRKYRHLSQVFSAEDQRQDGLPPAA